MIIINRSILFFCLLSSFFSVNGSFKKNISDTFRLILGAHPNLLLFELNPTKKCIDFSMNTEYSCSDSKDIKVTDEVLCTGTKDLKTGKFHLKSHYRDRSYDVLQIDVLKKEKPNRFLSLKYTTELLESLHLGIKTRNKKKWDFNWYLKNKGILCLETNINNQRCSVKHSSGKTILDSATSNIFFHLNNRYQNLKNHNVYIELYPTKKSYGILNNLEAPERYKAPERYFEILNNLEIPDKKEKNKALSILRKISEKKRDPSINLSKIIKSLYKGTIETTIIKNSTDSFHNKIKHEFYCKKNLDTEKFNSKVTYAKILRQKENINGTFFPKATTTPKILPMDKLTENQKETIKMMKEKINLLHKAIETTFFFKNEKVANKTPRSKNL